MLAGNEMDKAEVKETDMEPAMIEACINITRDAQKRYTFDKLRTMMRGIGGIYPGPDVESDVESHLSRPPPSPAPPIARPNVVRGTTLSRVSQSEPHLDIPHFVHGQDSQHISSLTKVLSGLFEVDSALSTPFSCSQRSVAPLSGQPTAFDDGSIGTIATKVSGPRYPDSEQSAPPLAPLRKSSSASAVDWCAAEQPIESPSSSVQQFVPSFHRHRKGFAMSTTASRGPTSLSTAAQAFHVGGEPVSGAQVIVSEISSADSSPENTVDERAANAHHYGGVLSVFGRGFFAKPVIRSEEENYRYLMALDR